MSKKQAAVVSTESVRYHRVTVGISQYHVSNDIILYKM
jgi:hypothetical protein